jgi:hypothetical protein
MHKFAAGNCLFSDSRTAPARLSDVAEGEA